MFVCSLLHRWRSHVNNAKLSMQCVQQLLPLQSSASTNGTTTRNMQCLVSWVDMGSACAVCPALDSVFHLSQCPLVACCCAFAAKCLEAVGLKQPEPEPPAPWRPDATRGLGRDVSNNFAAAPSRLNGAPPPTNGLDTQPQQSAPAPATPVCTAACSPADVICRTRQRTACHALERLLRLWLASSSP